MTETARLDAESPRRWSQFREGAAYARALLRDRIDARDAAARVGARLREREASFLSLLRRVIFARADGPYRALLDTAGYDLGRVEALVARHGLEGALADLCRHGVYLSIEEVKGRREILRRGTSYRLTEDAFDNPLVTTGLTAWSGGTRGTRRATLISAGNHRMGAEHLVLALAAYGLERGPVIVWLTYAHGASLWAVLALAAARVPVPGYFTHLPPHGWDARYAGMRAAARLCGARLPAPTFLPIGDESRLLAALAAMRTDRPRGILTTPSSALRLALAARGAGARLDGVTFLTIAEPLTPAKLGVIQSVGARAYSSLGFTEFGRVTYGCPEAAAVDDGHVCLDAVAVGRRRRAVDPFGTELDALLFTTVRPDTRQVLLNVETGDYAAVGDRACGCALGALGFDTHLHGIRSFEKLNAEGPPFSGPELIGLIEETLPERFGGDPTDYQLLEEEDEQGFTRLSVLAHPRLGPIDDAAILSCVSRTLWNTQGAATRVWADARTLRVRRAAPIVTSAGKLMPLLHLRAAASPVPGERRAR